MINECNSICSECGKRIDFGICYAPSINWMYKVPKQRTATNDNYIYQCSYTCFDHAKLRNPTEQMMLTNENFARYVQRCEDMMKSQEKEILHPIDIKEKRTKKSLGKKNLYVG